MPPCPLSNPSLSCPMLGFGVLRYPESLPLYIPTHLVETKAGPEYSMPAPSNGLYSRVLNVNESVVHGVPVGVPVVAGPATALIEIALPKTNMGRAREKI